jgi:hypothetical protein
MYFLYVFILQFLHNSTCFERPFLSSSGVHNLLYLQFCTNHLNVSLRGLQVAVCSQINTKHINTVCGQNVQLLNVKLLVHHVTGRL